VCWTWAPTRAHNGHWAAGQPANPPDDGTRTTVLLYWAIMRTLNALLLVFILVGCTRHQTTSAPAAGRPPDPMPGMYRFGDSRISAEDRPFIAAVREYTKTRGQGALDKWYKVVRKPQHVVVWVWRGMYRDGMFIASPIGFDIAIMGEDATVLEYHSGF